MLLQMKAIYCLFGAISQGPKEINAWRLVNRYTYVLLIKVIHCSYSTISLVLVNQLCFKDMITTRFLGIQHLSITWMVFILNVILQYFCLCDQCFGTVRCSTRTRISIYWFSTCIFFFSVSLQVARYHMFVCFVPCFD